MSTFRKNDSVFETRKCCDCVIDVIDERTGSCIVMPTDDKLKKIYPYGIPTNTDALIQKKSRTVVELMNDDWIDVADVPEHISFRCLIRFEELDPSNKCHMSTGWYFHKDKRFVVDHPDMNQKLTEHSYIPLYTPYAKR